MKSKSVAVRPYKYTTRYESERRRERDLSGNSQFVGRRTFLAGLQLPIFAAMMFIILMASTSIVHGKADLGHLPRNLTDETKAA